jgi:hypothetical protein
MKGTVDSLRSGSVDDISGFAKCIEVILAVALAVAQKRLN